MDGTFDEARDELEMSGIVCGDTVYGSSITSFHLPKCVFACSLGDLFKSLDYSIWSRNWNKVSSLPVVVSTLASMNGNLLAIGGRNHAGNHTIESFHEMKGDRDGKSAKTSAARNCSCIE